MKNFIQVITIIICFFLVWGIVGGVELDEMPVGEGFIMCMVILGIGTLIYFIAEGIDILFNKSRNNSEKYHDYY